MHCCNQLCQLVINGLRIAWRSKLWLFFELAFSMLILCGPTWLSVHLTESGKIIPQYTFKPFNVTGYRKDIPKTLWYECNARKTIVYCSPSSISNISDQVMNEVRLRYNDERTPIAIESCANETEMIKRFNIDDPHCGKYIAGVVFINIDINEAILEYQLGFRDRNYWHTDDRFDLSDWSSKDEREIDTQSEYLRTGFLSLQMAIDSTFINIVNNQHNNISIELWQMPMPQLRIGGAWSLLKMLPIQLFIGFIMIVIHTSRNISSEKENRLKDYMMVMGLNSMIFYSAHLVLALLKTMIITIAVIIPICTILIYTDITVFIVTMLIYSFGTVMFAITISSLFHISTHCLRASILIWIISGVIMSIGYLYNDQLTTWQSLILSLNINSALYFALQSLSNAELNGDYLNWIDVFTLYDTKFSFGMAFGMMIFDIFWMAMLTYYLDKVYPGNDSPHEHALFFLMPSYWCRRTNTNIDNTKIQVMNKNDNIETEDGMNPDHIDIDVRNLVKSWTNSERRAVDHLTFRAYRGQVTVLLGQNGAGKSTTFAMLTGMTLPTSGNANVFGYSISDQLDIIRKHVGFCAQYNALFDKLTVIEHLHLFCRLKRRNIDDGEINDLLNTLQLTSKRNEYACQLSGGMKRKLSMAIALVGGSEVVILDEPTAGMDPSARHATWTLVQREKAYRTILLTTHYMEEADLLGDRIAILSEGRLICMGSSHFLKQRFGSGYILTIALTNNHTIDTITSIVGKYCPSMSRQNSIGNDIVFNLATIDKNKFSSLFAQLEMQQHDLCIDSFGLSLSTLEQVFLSVGNEVNVDKVITDDTYEHASNNSRNGISIDDRKHTGIVLILSQMQAMFYKRVIYSKEHWLSIVIQIIIPVLLFAICILITNELGSTTMNSKAIKLTPALYIPTNYIIQSYDMELSNILHNVIEHNGLYRQWIDNNTNITNYIIDKYKSNRMIIANHLYTLGAIVKSNIIIGLFNGRGYHTSSIILSTVNNARLRYTSNITTSSITVFNKPINNNVSIDTNQSAATLLVAILMIPCLSIITSSFATIIVYERESWFRQMQLFAGLYRSIYWMCQIISDTCIYTIAIALFTMVILIADLFHGHVIIVIIIWYTYLYAIIPIVYCISFAFIKPTKAYVTIFTMTVITAIIMMIIRFVTIASISEQYSDIKNIIEIIALILLPAYSMGGAIITIALPMDSSYFDWNNIGRNLIFMIITGTISWILLILIEFDIRRRIVMYFRSNIQTLIDETDDVRLERQRVRQMLIDAPITLDSIGKCYDKLFAVNSLTFSVELEECFGLLGVNGAGKSTTFNMLTGHTDITYGDAFIRGISVRKHWQKACKQLGYCRQDNSTMSEFTGRQLLTVLGLIHGLTSVRDSVNAVLNKVDIQMLADKRIIEYSGGNHRRLSVAMAILGVDTILLLDEPTTGVDPRARRDLWNILSSVRSRGTAILLTSHSMDECEALCTRIGIMVKGQLCCIGTSQQIKSRFGQFYSITINARDISSIQSTIDAIMVTFPTAIFKQSYLTQLYFDLPRLDNDRWSVLFDRLDKCATRIHAVDYSLSQCSLEQAFLQLSGHRDADQSSLTPIA